MMDRHAESILETGLVSDAHVGRRDHETPAGPYEYSLLGEYSRMVLLLLAVPLLLWFVQLASQENASFVSIVSALVLLASLLSGKGPAWLRSLLVVAMTFNVLAVVINPEDAFSGRRPANYLTVPNVILLFGLASASVFELGALTRQSSPQTRWKAVCWSMLAIPAVIYAVGIPVATSLWESLSSEASQSFKNDPNWTLSREISFRGAKLVVFVAFTYSGACLGSFLNVFAWCIPRGESFAVRDSNCPKCSQKIRRIDNLPIFSYVNLAAKCRHCDARIPARYLIVELVCGAIFGSLFLFELVTGASNVPGASVLSHRGILWIILYPKWKVIGIYFFHAAFMCSLLVLSLIEIDRQKLKLHLVMSLLGLFALLATICYPLQPVPPGEFLASLGLERSAVMQVLKLTAGGIVGGLVGLSLTFAYFQNSGRTFVPAMILTGILLGWQSVLLVSVLFALIAAVSRFIPWFGGSLSDRPTSVLLIAVMVHHPFWKMTFDAVWG